MKILKAGDLNVLDLSTDSPVEYRVTNQVQKIFSKKISTNDLTMDIVGKNITSMKVSFDRSIVATTKYSSNLASTLGQDPSGGESICSYSELSPCHPDDISGICSIEYAEPFLVKKGQGYQFKIRVQTKRTVERDALVGEDLKMIAPTFAIEMVRS